MRSTLHVHLTDESEFTVAEGDSGVWVELQDECLNSFAIFAVNPNRLEALGIAMMEAGSALRRRKTRTSVSGESVTP
jgi:hypothetical protein